MMSLDHCCVLRCFGAVLDPAARDAADRTLGCCIVTELCPLKSLRGALDQLCCGEERGPKERAGEAAIRLASWATSLKVACDVARGMAYLYSKTPPVTFPFFLSFCLPRFFFSIFISLSLSLFVSLLTASGAAPGPQGRQRAARGRRRRARGQDLRLRLGQVAARAGQHQHGRQGQHHRLVCSRDLQDQEESGRLHRGLGCLVLWHAPLRDHIPIGATFPANHVAPRSDRGPLVVPCNIC